MRFSMFYIFSVLGMVGLSGAALGEITKYPNGKIEPYGYAKDISVNAQYYTWECQKAAEIEGTLVTEKSGPNRATCKWECPVGYCWSDASSCNLEANERARTIYRTFVVDPTKTDNGTTKIVADGDADEDGELDYGTDIHKKAYVTWTYGGIMAFTDSVSGSVKGCIPNYAYDYFVCNYTDVRSSVKASNLEVDKAAGTGTCTFTCADGYNKGGNATYDMTASAGENGSQVSIKASACDANTYTVAYNANNGSGTMAASSHTYDVAKALTANAFSRTGYTFAGWNTQANGKGTPYANSASVKNLTTTNKATVTLYAQWTANTYTVTLNDNGGSGGSGTVKEVYNTQWTNSSNTKITSVTVPTRGDGYKFTGYYTAASGGNQVIPATGVLPANTTLTSNTTLYAQWSANVYDITYDCGTGATFGTTDKQTKTYENAATYGAAYEIPLDAYCTHPTKPFGGWNFPSE